MRVNDAAIGVEALASLPPVMGATLERGADFAQRHDRVRGAGRGALPVGSLLFEAFGDAALERGQVYRCDGDAARSMSWALVAPASREGSWIATVDMATLGMMAAREHGVALQRLVCIDTGGDATMWHRVVGNCVDGMDVVMVESPRCSAGDARRITARLRATGSVLVIVGDPGAFSPVLSIRATTTRWHFSTHAHRREMHVSLSGRGGHRSGSWRIVVPASGTH